MSLIQDLRKTVNDTLSRRAVLSAERDIFNKKYDQAVEDEKTLIKVRDLLQRAAQLCQRTVEAHLSEVVSKALSAVFEDQAYKFGVKYALRNNTTECDLFFVSPEGKRMDPLDSCGFGAADIASMALRFAYWSLERSRNVLVTDEPFRQLDSDRMPLASEMLKVGGQEMNTQLIVITHEDKTIAPAADRRFKVRMTNPQKKISKVTQIDQGLN